MTRICVVSRKGEVVEKIDRKVYQKAPTGFYKNMSFVKYKSGEYHVSLNMVNGVLQHAIYLWN